MVDADLYSQPVCREGQTGEILLAVFMAERDSAVGQTSQAHLVDVRPDAHSDSANTCRTLDAPEAGMLRGGNVTYVSTVDWKLYRPSGWTLRRVRGDRRLVKEQ